MKIKIRNGYEDPNTLFVPDIRVIVDVFRASTTAVAILEKEPTEFLIANDLPIIERFASQSYRVVSEVFDMGLDNSPSQVRDQMSLKEKVIQKTTNLTTAIEHNFFDGITVIGCFNNLSAVVNFIHTHTLKSVEIVPAGQMAQKVTTVEDTHCAEMIQAALLGNFQSGPNVELMLGNFKEKKRRVVGPNILLRILK